jgi:transcriptional regulator with XRE-family HTH domain
LSEIERGKATNVTIDIVFQLAEALGISVPYLLGLSDAPTSADDGAPIEAGQDRLVFEVRDPELRALMVELADLMHGMTPAQRRYFADQARLMRRLMEEEESRAKNPIIIG